VTSIKIVKIPDEYFLVRLANIYGAQILTFPSYTNSHGIEFIYKVPLAMVARMAKRLFYKEVQGIDPVEDETGKLICRRCHKPIETTDKYCAGCGFKLNWGIKAIYKRTTNQTKDDDLWTSIEAEEKATAKAEAEVESQDQKPVESKSKAKPETKTKPKAKPTTRKVSAT